MKTLVSWLFWNYRLFLIFSKIWFTNSLYINLFCIFLCPNYLLKMIHRKRKKIYIVGLRGKTFIDFIEECWGLFFNSLLSLIIAISCVFLSFHITIHSSYCLFTLTFFNRLSEISINASTRRIIEISKQKIILIMRFKNMDSFHFSSLLLLSTYLLMLESSSIGYRSPLTK